MRAASASLHIARQQSIAAAAAGSTRMAARW